MNFNKIIEKNRQNVRKIIRLITNEQNEDIEQEVYIKVWQNKEKYEEKGKMTGWIGTIAKNLSKDYLKSAAYKKRADADETVFEQIKDKKASPELKLIQNERQKRIIDAINNLKPKYKEVIMLYEIEGMPYEKIAKKLNCPMGTVKSRLFNAKKELYEVLKDLI